MVCEEAAVPPEDTQEWSIVCECLVISIPYTVMIAQQSATSRDREINMEFPWSYPPYLYKVRVITYIMYMDY